MDNMKRTTRDLVVDDKYGTVLVALGFKKTRVQDLERKVAAIIGLAGSHGKSMAPR